MNLTGQPVRQKQGRAPKAPRKALPPRSPKREAYMRSKERKAAQKHMAAVAQLPCLVCGCYGVEVHHEGKPRSDWNVLPLCPRHHRREFGPTAYHYSPKAFYAAHGPSKALLDRVAQQLRALEDDCLAASF
ncbi:hypothetical protein BVG79_01057 [Ketogulonicigenium robustum]|uniref:Uncharacterized protein n=1 Tax=Ketogulonicigenium robustum TaxID=92947 RepID=A0A1W6NZ25_9RHOB|nr:hypothetical protein [Ketogulonicigenium robustum]ARO14403.1 hypothetical protein BVG79_01057 [Ketogulonicigenium robustum]